MPPSPPPPHAVQTPPTLDATVGSLSRHAGLRDRGLDRRAVGRPLDRRVPFSKSGITAATASLTSTLSIVLAMIFAVARYGSTFDAGRRSSR